MPRRRDAAAGRRDAQTMQLMWCLVENGVAGTSAAPAVTTIRAAESDSSPKLTRLTEADDVEACLTTFECMMAAYEKPRSRWAFKLAPQLTGKAQRSYAALPADRAGDYIELREAILLRYNINEETYRQRFRAAKFKDGETPRELATRLRDLASRWTKGCTTVDDVLEVFVKEQLLNTLPEDIRLFVTERKPATSAEAGQLAMDFLQARKASAAPGKTKAEPNKKNEQKASTQKQCLKCGRQGHRT